MKGRIMASNTGIEALGAVNHMKKKGILKIVIIGFALGVTLLIVGSFFFGEKEKKSDNGGNAAADRVTFENYKDGIKREIEGICLKVGGVKSASAVVFFDGVGESIYAQNTQSGNTHKQEYVIIGSGSGAHALYIGESLPPLSGIGVVCDTGGSDNLKNEIAALLAATYGLPLTRIYVSEGQG